MAQFGPDARLSSIIDDWAPYYVARTQAVLDGTWEQVDVWDGIKPGMVEIGSFSDKRFWAWISMSKASPANCRSNLASKI